jgi:hypothetical protein
MSCGNCGRQNPPGAIYCLDCGQKLRETGPLPTVPAPFSTAAATPEVTTQGAPSPVAAGGTVRCTRCNAENLPSVRFCTMCGAGLPGADNLATAPGGGTTVSPSPVLSAPPPAALVPVSAAPPAAVAAPQAPAPQAPVPQAPNLPPTRAESRTDNFGAVTPGTGVAQIVTILKDGSEGPCTASPRGHRHRALRGQHHPPDDPYLSPRHARIQKRGERYYLRDLGSVNGVFQRIREPVELHHGDVLLAGQQVLRSRCSPTARSRSGR